MIPNIANEDLRSIRTKKSLYAAMALLLRKGSFRKITIKGICEEASISRAAFYAHFIDKYDLLEHSVTKLFPKKLYSNEGYEQLERAVNHHTYENIVILENLLCDADEETLDILFKYILSTMNLSEKTNQSEGIYAKNVVLSNFYAGGMLSYLFWQVNNKFPSDVPPMNKYVYEIVHMLEDWKSK